MLYYEGFTHLNGPQAEFTVNGYPLHFQDPFNINLETTREINILIPSNTRIVLLFRAIDGIYEYIIKYHQTSFNNSDIIPVNIILDQEMIRFGQDFFFPSIHSKCLTYNNFSVLGPIV